MSACRSCGASVRWAVTSANKKMPVDVAPVVDGNLVIEREGPTPEVRYLAADEETEKDRYVSHFATCPQAKEWRA